MKNKYLVPAFLIILGILSHLQWFNIHSTLTFSDWFYWPQTPVKELLQSSGTWSSFWNMGTANIQIPFILFDSVWSLIVHLGGSFDQAVKITFLIPIALLSFLAPYILFRKLSDSDLIGFVIALFYGTTTYILVRESVHLPIAYVYSIAPLILWLLIRALESYRGKDWVFFLIAYCIGISYEVRIVFILTFILAAYAMVFHRRDIFEHKRITILVAVAVIGINCYWLLPTGLGLQSSVSSVADRGLFGDHLFDLRHAIALSDSSWSGGQPNQNFVSQPVPWYLWLIPVLGVFPFFFIKKLTPLHRRRLIFFGSISLVGILLTKQSAPPIPGLYGWLYDHFPGFSLFREASKFYLITALGYAGLLSCSLIVVKRYTPPKLGLTIIFSVIIAATAMVNIMPLITQEIGGVFVDRHIPQDYKTLEAYLGKDPGYFRTYWTPTYSRWSPYQLAHPEISAIDMIQGDWKTQLPEQARQNVPQNEKLQEIFMQPSSEQLFNNASIKYVIVPLQDTRNDDDFFKFYGGSREYYISTLDKVAWLKKIDIGTPNLSIYENTNYGSHVSSQSSLIRLEGFPNLSYLEPLLHSIGLDGSGTELVSNKDTGGSTQSTKIDQLFSNPTISYDAKGVSVQDNITSNANSKTSLYINNSSRNLYYSMTASEVKLYEMTIPGLSINGAKIKNLDTNLHPILTLPIGSKDGPMYLHLNDRIILLKIGDGINLGPAAIYSIISINTVGKNFVTNSTFEHGLWQNTVSDCDNYDSHPNISMALSDEVPPLVVSGKSLALRAIRHDACTSEIVPVRPGHFQFSLNFKSINAKTAGYYIRFNDAKKTVVKDRLPIEGKDWQTILRELDVPDGASSVSIGLYAYESDGINPNDVLYDSIQLREPSKISKANIEIEPAQYSNVAIPLGLGANQISLKNDDFGAQNDIPNPSFEDGTWNAKVGDCNAYDQKGMISQQIIKNDSTDGSRSLQLAATTHIACASEAFQIHEPGDHIVSFDYESTDSKAAGYNIQFNDSAKTTISGQPSISNSKWEHFNKRISVPVGANSATLTIYAYSTDGLSQKIVRYDNFRLTKIPDVADTFFLVTKAESPLGNPKELQVTNVNPTKQTVHVRGAIKPFLLSFAEGFNPGWKIYPRPISKTEPCTQVAHYNTKNLSQYLAETLSYKLQRGDRYSTVATKYGVNYAQLLSLNHVDLNAQAVPGTIIQIPKESPLSANAGKTGEASECQSKSEFFSKDDLSYMTQKPAFDESHIMLNGFANGWIVDPTYIKAHYSKNYYRENTDGSIDMNLVVYFQPQSYFYIGITISAATLAACLGFLSYGFIRRNRSPKTRRDRSGEESLQPAKTVILAELKPKRTRKKRIDIS